MKKNLLKSLLAVALLLVCGNVWGETVTLKYTAGTTANMTGENDAALVGLDASVWSVVSDKGEGSNHVGLNKDGSIRLYYNENGGSTLTISLLSEDLRIESVKVSCASGYNNFAILVDEENAEEANGVYSINSNSFVITNANTSSVQVRITSIEINYGSASDTRTNVTMSFSSETVTAALGETFSAPTLTVEPAEAESEVSFTSSKSDVATVTPAGVVTIKAAGTTTITASIVDSEDYKDATASYTLTVVDPDALGQKNNPYTVARAIEFIGTLSGATSDVVYVKGLISQIDEVSTEHGNATYWISDDGTTTSQLEVYRGKSLDGADFQSVDEIKLNDEVVVKGNLKDYNGTSEFSQGSSIVSLTHSEKVDVTITFTANGSAIEELSINVGDEVSVTTVCSFEGAELTFNNSNVDVATYAEGKVTALAAGTTVITVSFAGNNNYKPATATLTVKVTDPNGPGSEAQPYTVAQALAFIETLGGTTSSEVYVKGIISKINSVDTGDYGNATYFISDDGTTTNQLEIYRGFSLNGKKFTSKDEIQLGDVVVVKGNLKKYNTTPEFDAGSAIVSLDRKQTATIAFINAAGDTISTLAATVGDEVAVTVNCDVEGAELTFENNNEAVATYTDGVVTALTKGTATITATFAGNDEYKPATATLTVTVEEPEVQTYAVLPFEFDGGKADIEGVDGFTQNGLGSDYSSSPKLKFDHTGDYLILHFNESPGKLTYDIKGNTFSGGTFKVQTSADGVNYSDLKTYSDFTGSIQSEVFYNLGDAVRYIKWIYTEKVSGNVALGNISLAKYAAPVNFTLSIEEPEFVIITANYGEEVLQNGEEAEVEAGTEITLALSINEGYDLESLTVVGDDGQTVTLTQEETVWTFNMPEFDVRVNASVVEHVEPVLAYYTLATSVTPGKRYVIASGKEDDVVVMAEQGTNNRRGVIATVADGKLAVPEGLDFVIEGNATDGYTIYDDSEESRGYLYAAGSDKNYLKTQEENDVNGLWTITFDAEGQHASIVATQSENRNVMQYNSGSSLFSCYASASQSPVYLYQLVENSAKTGDVNEDGEVNVTDVTALVSMILGNTPKNDAADVNGDGEVNVTDVTALVSIILGQ